MDKSKIKVSDLEKTMYGVLVPAKINLHLEQQIISDLYKIMYEQFELVFEIVEDR